MGVFPIRTAYTPALGLYSHAWRAKSYLSSSWIAFRVSD
jgi:hypothetical protein